MNIDLSRQEVELVIRRFSEAEQPDIDEQILVKKLRDFFPEKPRHPLNAYLTDFKNEPPLPPAPAE
jgi:hypothetical protein